MIFTAILSQTSSNVVDGFFSTATSRALNKGYHLPYMHFTVYKPYLRLLFLP